MNGIRRRPLSVGPIRAFEAVSRHLNFRAAAEELNLTQSAVSRQIQSLEEDLGAVLFLRGTRRVELTSAGSALLRAVAPALDQMDMAVRQIRRARGRRVVSVSTFASFATLWLIPRLQAFQREHPQIDIRLSASDVLVDPDGNEAGEIDIALRYCRREQAGPAASRLFGEQLTPVVSPWLLEHARSAGPPLQRPADLAAHALMEEDDSRPSAAYLNWSAWLRHQGLADLQPARWLYFNYTHQQVQAALAGQGVALARLALTAESLARGELVEPFSNSRIHSPFAYWLVKPATTPLSEDGQRFCEWVEQQAALTREAIGETLS